MPWLYDINLTITWNEDMIDVLSYPIYDGRIILQLLARWNLCMSQTAASKYDNTQKENITEYEYMQRMIADSTTKNAWLFLMRYFGSHRLSTNMIDT